MKISEAKLARMLLEQRRHRSSCAYCFRINFKWHVAVIVLAAVVIMLWRWALLPAVVAPLALGALFGAFLRELRWYRSARKRWGFTEKIVDWERVERLAAEAEREVVPE